MQSVVGLWHGADGAPCRGGGAVEASFGWSVWLKEDQQPAW